MDHADPPLAGSLEPLHDSLAGTDAGLGEKYTMNAHRTSTEMSWGRETPPFPRPHPQEQNAAVYTKVWTHLKKERVKLVAQRLWRTILLSMRFECRLYEAHCVHCARQRHQLAKSLLRPQCFKL